MLWGDGTSNYVFLPDMNTVVSTLIYLAVLVLVLVYRILFGTFLWTADKLGLAEAGKTFRKENLL